MNMHDSSVESASSLSSIAKSRSSNQNKKSSSFYANSALKAALDVPKPYSQKKKFMTKLANI